MSSGAAERSLSSIRDPVRIQRDAVHLFRSHLGVRSVPGAETVGKYELFGDRTPLRVRHGAMRLRGRQLSLLRLRTKSERSARISDTKLDNPNKLNNVIISA